MKKFFGLTGTLAVLAGLSLAVPNPKTFRGQIMDSVCAGSGNHNAGYKLTNTSTPKDCTLACVKNGASLVLYNPEDKTTYKLSDQKRAMKMAGQEVQVTGTLDQATNTIQVTRISASKS
jgi:hypothetical protein